jgi:hypothetical protein
MNPYAMLASGIETNEAASLAARLSAWHDAMVAHERRLRAGSSNDACDDECPHAEARALWSEATATFGSRATDLTFLRSRAAGPQRPNAAMKLGPVKREVGRPGAGVAANGSGGISARPVLRLAQKT